MALWIKLLFVRMFITFIGNFTQIFPERHAKALQVRDRRKIDGTEN